MLNVQLSYKPPISWRTLFWSGVRPGKFSCLKKSRELVVSGGGFYKGITFQGRQQKRSFSCGIPVILEKKRSVTGAYYNAPIKRNSQHRQMFRRSKY